MTQIDNHRNAARMFGVIFILTFLSYGVGSGMADAVTRDADFLNYIRSNTTTLVTGAVLMAIVHSFMNIALPVIMLPILKPVNERLAVGYLGAAIAATTILAIGALLLLMLVPLGETYAIADSTTQGALMVAATTLKAGAALAYHMGMAIWALGGMLFCAVLYQSKLLPRFLPVWGMFGYIVLAAGSVSELLVHNPTIEIISVVPGGLFEVTLSLWLIFRGFERANLANTIQEN